MREVTSLPFQQTATKTTYHDGVFQILTGASAPPGYVVLEAYALEIDPGDGSASSNYDDNVTRPVRFCCKGDCQKCTKPTCSPDLAQAEPPTTGGTATALAFAVRSGGAPGWSLDEPTQMLTLAGASPTGPVYVGPVPATLEAEGTDAVKNAVSAWLGVRTTAVVMHLFRLRHPLGAHPLHDKIIGIPAVRVA
ncbi:MAG TPA: hypothetical protein VIU61_09435 [Kofleriaceae bacterium]